MGISHRFPSLVACLLLTTTLLPGVVEGQIALEKVDKMSLERPTPLDKNRDLERLLKTADELLADGLLLKANGDAARASDRFGQAIALWQKVLDNVDNSMVSQNDLTVKAQRSEFKVYQSMSRQIELRLRNLPADVYSQYRLSADAEALPILNAARETRDPQSFKEVVQRYFLSHYGDEAAYELAAYSLDRGDYIGASRLLSRLRGEHPEAAEIEQQIALRQAIASARVGDQPAALKSWREYEQMRDDASLRDPQQVLQDVTGPPPTEHARFLPPGDWFLSYGGPARNFAMPPLPALSTTNGLSESWIHHYPVSLNGRKLKTTNINQTRLGGFRSGRVSPVLTRTSNRSALVNRWMQNGWVPASDLVMNDGRFYFNSHERVVCCDAATGKMLWAGRRNQYLLDPLSNSYGNTTGVSTPSSLEEVRLFGDRVHPALSLGHQKVYCLEGKMIDINGPAHPGLAVNGTVSRYTMRRSRHNRLAAYDAVTGMLIWNRLARSERDKTPVQYPSDEGEEEGDQTIGFLAAPVPAGNRLLIPVSDNGEIWLHALNHSDGSEAWKIYLCDDPYSGAKPWSPVAIAVEGDDAYIGTGMGLVFAVDVDGGQIHWATRYERQGIYNVVQNSRSSRPTLRTSPVGWLQDTVIPQGRRLIVAASGSESLFALDRRNGRLLWTTPRQYDGEESVDECLGVLGDHLFVSGRRVVRRYNVTGGKLTWEAKLENACGRGFVTRDALYVPDGKHIAMFHPETGKQLRKFGLFTPTDEPVGNLYSDGHQLLVVGLERVYAIQGLEHRLEELAKQIAEGDGRAQLTRMRLRHRLGETEAAIIDLREGIQKLLTSEGVESAHLALFEGLQEIELATSQPRLCLEILSHTDPNLATKEPVSKKDDPIDLSPRASFTATAPQRSFPHSLVVARSSLVLQSLTNIRKNQDHAALPTVLDASFLYSNRAMEDEALLVVKELARAEDRELLESTLESEGEIRRHLAVEGLVKVMGEDVEPLMWKLMKDPADRLRLRSAVALANLGKRETLPVLAELLTSKLLGVRVKSAYSLRALTGQRFQYVAYGDENERIAAAKKWQEWVAEAGTDVELKFPISLENIILGRTLIAAYSSSEVYELDPGGKKIWSKTGLTQPWSVQGLPNGNRLVALYSQRTVVEVDIAGNEVWKKMGLPGTPYCVRRTASGNTLVACSNNTVIEYRPDGSTARTIAVNGTPRSVQALPNGHVLVAIYSQSLVVEFDANSKRVLELKSMSRPIAAQRLKNGNTFVVQSSAKRMVEVTPQGETVWSKAMPRTLYHAQRLPNGNMAVVDSSGFAEYDRYGKVIRQHNHSGIRAVHIY